MNKQQHYAYEASPPPIGFNAQQQHQQPPPPPPSYSSAVGSNDRPPQPTMAPS